MEFAAGDIVEMKSGGPRMTVRGIKQDGDVVCSWFNQNGGDFEYKFHYFPAAMLRKIKEQSYS